MRMWAVLGAASVFMAGQASLAQDLSFGMPGVRDWSGLYVGAGASFSRHAPSDDRGILSLPSASGVEVGLMLGYSWSTPSLVYGLEAVGNFGDSVGVNACCQTTIQNSLLVRGRVGVPAGNTLFFGTLGVASDQWALRVTPGGSASIRYTGLALGAGAEVALSDVVSLRGEVEHYNFGSRRNVTGGNVSYRTNAIRFSMVRSF
jgi:outer membrane immunogenic protein